MRDSFLLINKSNIPIGIGSKIIEKDFREKLLMKILGQGFGIQFTEAAQRVEASLEEKGPGKALSLMPGFRLLAVTRS